MENVSFVYPRLETQNVLCSYDLECIKTMYDESSLASSTVS